MRKIREVLRLKHELGLGNRAIALSCKLSSSTVSDYLTRAAKANIEWPLPPDLNDDVLEGRLFKLPERQPASDIPDWADVDKQLKRKGVTRLLLWREYKEQHPDGMQYTTFNDQYRTWKASQGLSMRQHHLAGEKLFVDYAGMTLPITDPHTGEVTAAQVFVAALGASDYTYAEVTRTQSIPDWIGAHVRALEFFGGVPQVIVPDNLKTGINHPSRYEPELNLAYAEFAQHYGLAVIPARIRKPKDKSKAEVHVQIVERQILAPLRDRVFFSLSEANEAVTALLLELNNKPFQKLPGSRRSQFEELDQSALRPLPVHPFQLAEWKIATVGIDYHVEAKGRYYSVPYQHARTKVDVRITDQLVEVYRKGERIAVHQRLSDQPRHRGKHVTIHDHMPKSHQSYGEWTPERLTQWAYKIGQQTGQFIEALLDSRAHPMQGVRSALGVLRLAKEYGNERLDAACGRALTFRALEYRSVQSILKKKLDLQPVETTEPPAKPIQHRNVRGASYYQRTDVALVESDPALN